MFDYFIDLFVCLNIAVKGLDYFTEEDFLYLMDNFAFFIKKEEDFI